MINIEEQWEEYWESKLLTDETFIAPGYAGAEMIVGFVEQVVAAIGAENKRLNAKIDVLTEQSEKWRKMWENDHSCLSAAKNTIALLDTERAITKQLEAENERLKENLKAISYQSNPRAHVLGLLEENERLREALHWIAHRMNMSMAASKGELCLMMKKRAAKALRKPGGEEE